MDWTLDQVVDLPDGALRWRTLGEGGEPIVLVHGTPYSSLLWRDIAPALAQSRRVYVFDHLGYGQSDKRDGQDLTLAAQARNFMRLLDHSQLSAPSVVANDIGGAIVLRALLLEGARYSDMTLFDCVSGGEWERGLFAQIRAHPRGVRAAAGLRPPRAGHQPPAPCHPRRLPTWRHGGLPRAVARRGRSGCLHKCWSWE